MGRVKVERELSKSGERVEERERERREKDGRERREKDGREWSRIRWVERYVRRGGGRDTYNVIH